MCSNSDCWVSRKRVRHEDILDRVGPMPGHGGDLYGLHGPRMRRPRPAAIHTGHAAAANAVVFGRRPERSAGQQ